MLGVDKENMVVIFTHVDVCRTLAQYLFQQDLMLGVDRERDVFFVVDLPVLMCAEHLAQYLSQRDQMLDVDREREGSMTKNYLCWCVQNTGPVPVPARPDAKCGQRAGGAHHVSADCCCHPPHTPAQHSAQVSAYPSWLFSL